MTPPIAGSDYYWTSREGLRLHARDYAGDCARLPVICIPGLTRNARDFEDLAPWIAERGRRVLAVDLRGRGQSARDPDRRRYQPRVYAEDMAALLRSIGAPKAIFVGASLGGLVTMTLAARNPALIGGAVLNDVGPQVAKAGLARIRSYVGKSAPIATWADAAAYAKRINGVAFPNYPDEAWPPIARRLFREGEGGRPELDYDPHVFKVAHPIVLWLAQPLVWAAFRRLAKAGPLLLIHGEITDIIDGDTIGRMKRAAPRVAVAEVPGVGHAPMLNEPVALAALEVFLDKAP
jgi:pimeloyl-ACP methyl ester carboxylesterase